MVKAKHEWKQIQWDGNLSLNLQCWRKKFGRGHVSVGIGDFKAIVYSYGANSDDSLSGTRHRRNLGRDLSCEEAMQMVDENGGKHNWLNDYSGRTPEQIRAASREALRQYRESQKQKKR